MNSPQKQPDPLSDWLPTAYVLGELNDQQRGDFESQLAQSDALREEVADIRRTIDRVREALPPGKLPLGPAALSELRQRVFATPVEQSVQHNDVAVSRASHADSNNSAPMWSKLAFAALAASLVGVIAVPLFDGRSVIEQDPVRVESIARDMSTEDEYRPGEPADGMAIGEIRAAEGGATESPTSAAEAPEDLPLAQPEMESRRLSELSRSHAAAQPNDASGGAAASPMAVSALPEEQILSKSLNVPSAAEIPPVALAPAISERQNAQADFGAYGGGAGYGSAYGGADSYGGRVSGDAPTGGLAGPAAAAGAPAELNLGVPPESDALAAADPSLDAYYFNPNGRFYVPQEAEALRRRAPAAYGRHASGDRFEAVTENSFVSVKDSPLSTFSIDVDTASYSKIRQNLDQFSRMPDPNAVRVEEMINYFRYDYAPPKGDSPFATALAVGECPWSPGHSLVRIALQGKTIAPAARPKSNLVFLIDVSGSMDEPNKLPLVKKTIGLLTNRLTENDRVAMVVYAGAAGVVLPSVRGDQKQRIYDALTRLDAGGSTNGAGGIEAAYAIAEENYIPGGINRVILCTDGDFNVGVSSDQELVDLVSAKAAAPKVYMTCLGYGEGNYNDSMMEKISNSGNGVYAMIDSENEAARVMGEQIDASLVTIASDVKIQVEFNPAHIAAYRLIGYDNRMLAAEDFNNDAKDAGEINAGHQVTALYEVVPVGQAIPSGGPAVDQLRYAAPTDKAASDSADTAERSADRPVDAAHADELLVVKLRYKSPEAAASEKLEFPLKVAGERREVDDDFRWASVIAQFGLKLRQSRYAPPIRYSELAEQASRLAGEDSFRIEAVGLMRRAAAISGR